MKLIRAWLILICLFTVIKANAQPEQPYSAGIFGGLTITDNNTHIPIFWDSPACGTFENGGGKGWHIGLAFRYEFYSGFYAIGNVMYEHRSLDLSKDMTRYEVYNTETKTYVPLVEKFSFESQLDYMLIGVGINWMPVKSFPIYVALRMNAGNPLFKAEYTVKSEISSPDFALYPNDKKTFPISNGTINDAGTHVTAGIGLGADIVLDNGIVIVPEITYNYGLNYVVSASEWSTNLIRVGVGAFWQFGKEEAKPNHILDTIAAPDTAKAVIIKEKEIQLRSTAIKMSSVIVTETYPLLPYIFFDSASSVLKKKYQFNDDVNSFDEKALPKSTMPIYYHELDIIGKRMLVYHNSSITITGAGDGKEALPPEQRQKLNRERAQTVADYLIKRWKINPNRITVKSRDLPELPTGREYAEGNEENRRVEIISKDNRILAPIIHERFLEHSLENRPEINIQTTEQLKDWSIKLNDQSGSVIWEKSGKGDFPSDIIPILSSEQIQKLGEYSLANNSVECELVFTDHHDNSFDKKINIPVENLKKNYELGRLNLIVFDFDKAEISQTNKDIIRNFVSDAIKPNSKVRVTGSTDYLGEAQYNKKLSIDRAKSVADYIVSMVPTVKINSIEGLGEDSSKYDSSLPEGRFYCRTVLTEINTPIKVKK